MEKCSIVILPRDRFSMTPGTLDSVIAQTDASHPVLCVMGNVPKRFRDEWPQRYGDRVRFIFKEKFLNPNESRNIGLRTVDTRLAILMDNDVRVRAGWLDALMKCERETGAAMVVPLVLEGERTIHTAGNRFYVTYEKGKAFASKVLCSYKRTYAESSNLKREATDYGEFHCQLVVVKTALDLNVLDEKSQEIGECDSGLVWSKAGCAMYFEPSSVVVYDLPKRITDPDDIALFAWRWNMKRILEGYRHFRQKHAIDMGESGTFYKSLGEINSVLGLLPRLFPSRAALEIDYRMRLLRQLAAKSLKLWSVFKMRLWGAGDWIEDFKQTSGR